MKKNLLFVLFWAITSISFAQEKEGITFRIKEGKNNSEIQKHVDAFEKAKWDCYRLKSKPREIAFENGIIFELLPAIELMNSNIKINTSCLTNEDDLKSFKAPKYRLMENGLIFEVHEPDNTFKGLKSK